jgi:hypothetical protein
MNRKKAVLISVVVFLSGCSTLIVPYHNEPLCKKVDGGGYCGSITEVYHAVSEDIDRGVFEYHPDEQPSGETP